MMLSYIMQLMSHCEDVRIFNEKALSGDLMDLRNVHTSLGVFDSTFKDFCCIRNLAAGLGACSVHHTSYKSLFGPHIQ